MKKKTAQNDETQEKHGFFSKMINREFMIFFETFVQKQIQKEMNKEM